MSTHTDGPWSIDSVRSDDYGELSVTHSWIRSKPKDETLDGYVVASVVSDCVPEARANAHLIAAAPAMLAILKLVESRLYNCLSDGFSMGHGTMARLVDDVTETILLAKGERP